MCAVHMQRHQHRIMTLCQVLRNNRTCYKHYTAKPCQQEIENQVIRQSILSIYASSQQRPGGRKITRRLGIEYGIHISVGPVYRLMQSMARHETEVQIQPFKQFDAQ